MLAALALVIASAAAAWGAERGTDAAVREIIQSALDDALKEQITHIFAIWLRDPKGQPQRAAAGVRKAVAAYRHAVTAIETEKLTWRIREPHLRP